MLRYSCARKYRDSQPLSHIKAHVSLNYVSQPVNCVPIDSSSSSYYTYICTLIY